MPLRPLLPLRAAPVPGLQGHALQAQTLPRSATQNVTGTRKDLSKDTKHRKATQERRKRGSYNSGACETCRDLKRKCDGATPICATCRHRGEKCIYYSIGGLSRLETLKHKQKYLQEEHASLRAFITGLSKTFPEIQLPRNLTLSSDDSESTPDELSSSAQEAYTAPQSPSFSQTHLDALANHIQQINGEYRALTTFLGNHIPSSLSAVEPRPLIHASRDNYLQYQSNLAVLSRSLHPIMSAAPSEAYWATTHGSNSLPSLSGSGNATPASTAMFRVNSRSRSFADYTVALNAQTPHDYARRMGLIYGDQPLQVWGAVPDNNINQSALSQHLSFVNMQVPMHLIPPRNIPTDNPSPFNGLVTSFLTLARAHIIEGWPIDHVLGPYDFDVAPLLATEVPAVDFDRNDISVTGWATNVMLTFKDITPRTRVAAALSIVRIMRWVLVPTAENYSAMGTFGRPTPTQLLVPHTVEYDYLLHPVWRDALITSGKYYMDMAPWWHMDWDEDVPMTWMDSVSGMMFLTDEFQRAALDVDSWAAMPVLLRRWPEMTGRIRVVEESRIPEFTVLEI